MALKYPFLDLGKVNEPYAGALVAAAGRVIRSGRYIGGPEVDAFESDMARLCETTRCVGLSNGLDALRLTLRALVHLGRLNPGDGVIVPANTYIASVLAITDAGLRPVLVDPDERTMNLSARGIASALGPGVRAVMPVHLYGRVAWSDGMADIVRREGLLVVEDCAQAIGARSTAPGLNGTHAVGSIGHAGAFSFYPTKNVGALGDAGCVTTSDTELADTIRCLANYGSDRRYHNIYQGFNCRLDPIQAAMLRVKLPHTDRENADRRLLANIYSKTISRPDVITPLCDEPGEDCVWHQYVIRVTGGRRDLMAERLARAGVGTDIHYAVPPHLQPCYTPGETSRPDLPLEHGPLPVTELLASEILSLPIGRGTSADDAEEIASIINSIEL